MVGKRIRRLRRMQDWTQKDLAVLVGTHEKYIAMIEQGRRTPQAPLLGKLAAALGTTPMALLAEPAEVAA